MGKDIKGKVQRNRIGDAGTCGYMTMAHLVKHEV